MLSEDAETLKATGYLNAQVQGLGGNDVLQTSGANPSLIQDSQFDGGSRNDRLIVVYGDAVAGSNVYDGGLGNDTLELSSSKAFAMDVNVAGYANAVSFDGGTSDNLFVNNVELFIVKGSAFADTL